MSNDKNTIHTKVAFISLSVLQRYNLIFNLQNNSRKFFVKNEFYYFKNNFQKIFAYLKNFIIIICAYIIYYQKFLSNFHPLTSGRPKLPARCLLYNTCMITD